MPHFDDTLREIVDPAYLYALHDITASNINCPIAILDKQVQPITPELGHCTFCREIRTTKAGVKLCRDSDRKGMTLVRRNFEHSQSLEPVFYKCSLGLIDVCAPIIVCNEIKGYLMSGQLRFDFATIQANQQNRKQAPNAPNKSSLEEIFRTLAIDDALILDKLLDETRQQGESIDEDFLRNSFRQIPSFSFNQFESFYTAFSQLANLLNEFTNKLYILHKPEITRDFMRDAIKIQNVEGLYEIMANKLPLLFDAVGASIFVVHHDCEEGDRLVLQKTSFPDLKSKEKTAYYKYGEGLTGWVWANKRSLRIRNIKNPEEIKGYENLKWEQKYNDSSHHNSFLAVPIIGHNRVVLGVLRLPHKNGDVPFTNGDEIFLRFLADHLSKVIECQMAEDIVEQATGRSGLSNVATNIFCARSRREIIDASLNSSVQLFETTGKMHYLNLNLPGNLKWKIEAVRGQLDFSSAWQYREFSIKEGLSGKVIRGAKDKGKGDIKYDLEDARKRGEYVDLVHNGRSAMAAPIIWGPKVFGAICIVSEKKYEFIREKDLRILESLGVLIGVALQNYEQRRSKIVKTFLCLFRFGRPLWDMIVRLSRPVADDA